MAESAKLDGRGYLNDPMMKRAVIFDVGGVLCSPPQLAIAAYESRLRLPRYYYMCPMRRRCRRRTYRGAIGRVFSAGAPDNAFCRLERGLITLSQVLKLAVCYNNIE